MNIVKLLKMLYNIYMKIIKICTLCLVSFGCYPSNSKSTKQPFCTMKCYGEWQKGRKYEDRGRTKKLKSLCTQENCNKKLKGHGYCTNHYYKYIEKPKYNIKDKVIRLLNNCIHCLKQTKNKKYCSIKCYALNQTKPFIIKKGYKKILMSTHHRADKKGYTFEHIVVMENHIGRLIKFPEEVHHIDKNRANNDISNLLLCKNHKEHMQYHKH